LLLEISEYMVLLGSCSFWITIPVLHTIILRVYKSVNRQFQMSICDQIILVTCFILLYAPIAFIVIREM
jgi:hypothetical protein